MADWGISSDSINALFDSTIVNTQSRMDGFAATVLGMGIDHFQNQKYDMAITAFKRAAALSPFTDNAAKAYDYIGQAYLKQEKTDKAIKTYLEAIRIYPNRSEFNRALADIYLAHGQHEEAIAQYEAAVRNSPDDAESRYSLGQTYIKTGDLDKARQQFASVVQLTPISAAGFYGLGQVAHLQGDADEAITQLNKAIRVNKNFEIAYLELGYVYADLGDYQKAEQQLSILSSKNSDKTLTLSSYITNSKQPRILSARGQGDFQADLEPGTLVSDLNTRLENAGASALLSIKVAFSKDMDESSVKNPYNWRISRANLAEHGGVYNYGLKISSKEASLPSNPAYITFDASTNTATVYFRVAQNTTGDATIDPEHIVFKFSGLDAYGKAMDTGADEYSGFSGVA